MALQMEQNIIHAWLLKRAHLQKSHGCFTGNRFKSVHEL